LPHGKPLGSMAKPLSGAEIWLVGVLHSPKGLCFLTPDVNVRAFQSRPYADCGFL